MSQLEGAGTPENLALPLKLYWQPGCSSCLKMKEFVLEHGVPFESVNVLEDDSGFAELQIEARAIRPNHTIEVAANHQHPKMLAMRGNLPGSEGIDSLQRP